MERYVSEPGNIYEFLLGSPWPIAWAYRPLVLLAAIGVVATARVGLAGFKVPKLLIALPLIWLAWQTVAAAKTMDDSLSWATLKHFAACVLCFYLGLFCLGRARNL